MKKLLIVLLSVAVLFTFMPAAAFAETNDAQDDQQLAAEIEKALAAPADNGIQAAPGYDSDEDGSWEYHSEGWMFLVNGEGYATGWTKIDENWYYFDPGAVTGWQKLGGYWYYFAKDGNEYGYREGTMYANGPMNVNGKWYFFGIRGFDTKKEGKMQTGWITVPITDTNGEVMVKLCFYADPNKDSQLALGWNKIGGYWYYFAPDKEEEPYPTGMMYAFGATEVNGKYYYFPTFENPSKWGKLQSGWIKESHTYTDEYEDGTVITNTYTGWFYGDPANDSQLVTGWQKIGGKWYYFDPEEEYGYYGVMIANCIYEIKGKLWTFNRNGSLHETKGWVDLYDEWYENGKKVKESYWVYTDAKGIAYTGWQKIGGYWYYLGDEGYMYAEDWASDSKGTCWMDKNGHITKSKWIKSPWDGEWYYLKANGYRAENEWAKDSKGWMYMGEDGIALKGQFKDYNGHTFYLKDSGYMACNETIEIGSEVWAFDKNGYGTRIS